MFVNELVWMCLFECVCLNASVWMCLSEFWLLYVCIRLIECLCVNFAYVCLCLLVCVSFVYLHVLVCISLYAWKNDRKWACVLMSEKEAWKKEWICQNVVWMIVECCVSERECGRMLCVNEKNVWFACMHECINLLWECPKNECPSNFLNSPSWWVSALATTIAVSLSPLWAVP